MNRADRLLDDLLATLELAETLVARGKGAFDADLAMPLAFEALSNRVGDMCKQLVALDSGRFTAGAWSLAARHRDFVVHHYGRIDQDALWDTVSTAFPELRTLVALEIRRQ